MSKAKAMKSLCYLWFLIAVYPVQCAYIILVDIQDAQVGGTPQLSNVSYFQNWTFVLKNDTVQTSTTWCPAGRYCPAGVLVPVVCPLGTYSTMVGRATPCQDLCPRGYFCPDPSVKQLCPENTHSDPGGKSKGDCVCNEGFVCLYKKQMSVGVVLNMPLEVWLNNATLQELLKKAVAKAAGVDVGSVVIDRSQLYIVGGSGRRLGGLLSRRQSGKTEVELVVLGDFGAARRSVFQLGEKGALPVETYWVKTVDFVQVRRRVYSSLGEEIRGLFRLK